MRTHRLRRDLDAAGDVADLFRYGRNLKTDILGVEEKLIFELIFSVRVPTHVRLDNDLARGLQRLPKPDPTGAKPFGVLRFKLKGR
jgi:hypothetical protein